MATNPRSTAKKPVSLNDSHYRFLQDLSAPPKRSSSSVTTTDEDEDDQPTQRRNNQPPPDDTFPQFSAITDFDSPIGQNSPENPEPSKEEEATPPPEENFQCSAISAPSQNSPEKHEPSKEEEAPPPPPPEEDFQFSAISSLKDEKKTKVKVQGRRRLCKVAYTDDASENVVVDEHRFDDIVDLDTPVPAPKSVVRIEESGGRSEIRDILNELSSRFELLSMERKPERKVVEGFVGGELSSKFELLSEERKPVEGLVGGKLSSKFELLSEERKPERKPVEGLVGGELSSKFELLSEERKPVQKPVEGLVGKKEAFEDEGLEFGSAGSSFSQQQDNELDGGSGRGGGGLEDDSDDSVQELDHFEAVDDGSITLIGPISTYKLPGKIGKMLYPHQRDGLNWLWSLHCLGKGGILGDDMGLGKTMQICGFLAGLFHSRLIRRVLVVAPKTLLPHWIKELSVVGLAEKTREYFGTSMKLREYELQYILQDKGVLLTTYDIVRNNSKSLRGHSHFDDDESDDPTWDYMILDEGHLIKNPSTQRAKSLLEIPSAHRIIISGTPLQNNLKELWALFNFCCPELLGDNKWFKEKFESPILRGNDKNATDREKRVGSHVAKELRDRIQPYFLRRLKSEVFNQDDKNKTAELSQKQEIIVWLRLTSTQRHLYEAFLKSEIVVSAFDGSPLAAITILKKICDHALLMTKRAAEDVLEGMDSELKPEEANVAEKLAMHIADVAETDEFKDVHDASCKISFIMSLLDNLIPEGHNVLIFSQTRKMLNLIQENLAARSYDFLRIDGTTKASDRIKIVNDFQDGIGAPIFLLTTQVGGLGLTLTRADRVIVVDPAWNPSTDNQSVDRAYRIGQKKDVIVYRLMTCGTVEEKIYRKQVYKGGLFKTATEQKEQTRYFTQQDLKDLFSLPKEGFDVSVTQRQLNEKHDRLKVDDAFKAHIEFLKSLGIAGVSHHSLLFSKTEPVQAAPEEDEVTRNHRPPYIGSSKPSSHDLVVDGAEFAFNPKDVNLSKKGSSPSSAGKLSESEIKDQIKRLSLTLSNTAMVSKLPDKGEKLHKRMAELNVMLTKLKMEQREIIDLDDFTSDFQRVLNV
ncbi:protein CHROMATIN REMODELING 24 isoform X2 [Lotus japonicus]|uniref:protein CHROMATIN REMODELING 24 isoform X2 n=1 Tax=Lotus japonicus TaxID=34305 RepID=UPI00258F652C|nr:protein CHROMATIN REMODELING 24 isoform X2 [Lotus japonicus]